MYIVYTYTRNIYIYTLYTNDIHYTLLNIFMYIYKYVYLYVNHIYIHHINVDRHI